MVSAYELIMNKVRAYFNQDQSSKSICKIILQLGVIFICFTALLLLISQTYSLQRDIAQLKQEYHPIHKVTLPIDVPPASKTISHELGPEHHDFPEKTFPYPTLGIPVPGNTYNFTKVEKKDFPIYDAKVLEYLEPYNDTDCEYKRYGKANEGGYVVCKNFLKFSEAMINLGIEARDDFGCDLTTDYPMPNYQYDCTSEKAKDCPTNYGADSFYKICVGERTEQTQKFTIYSFQDMIRAHNLTRKHFTLKIDIESGEFQAFKYFPTEDLQYIDQIIMELHLDFKDDWGILDVLHTIYENFAVVSFHMNNNACDWQDDLRHKVRKLPNWFMEIAMVNRRLLKINRDTRSFVEHPLNARNHPHVPNCP